MDIYIPKHKIAIEYDGDNWHQNSMIDKKKDDLCKENNITLIRVREPFCPSYETSAIIIKTDNPTNSMIYMEKVVREIIHIINTLVDEKVNLSINIKRDYSEIIELIELIEVEDSIVNCELFKEWNFEKNIKLNPKSFKPNSNKKVWWKCKLGHEWYASPNARHNGKSGCPFCGNKKVLSGFNDLLTTNFELCKDWNYEKNILKPTEVTKNSNKKVWWKCEFGHEWEAIISSRSRGNKCPICANQKLLVGYNDLATKYPDLALEWDYEKNIDLTPQMVLPGTDKKVWWKCK